MTESDPFSAAHRPVVAVELVILTVIGGELNVLLDRRTEHPFKGTWSLPAGILRVDKGKRQGESIDDCAHRTLHARTGVSHTDCFIEQLHTFGRAGRDPRTRIISIAWMVGIAPEHAAAINDTDSKWCSVSEDVPWMRLGFDHAEIIAKAEERVHQREDNSGIAFALAPNPFTVSELRTAFEALSGRSQDARNFRRRFQRMVDDKVVQQAPGTRHMGKSRPAQVWRLANPPTKR